MIREGLQGGSPARGLITAGTASTAAMVGPVSGGAATGAGGPTVGASETRVSRWMGEGEYGGMKSTGVLQTGAGNRTFVTLPGAPQPGGTGPVRVDFNVPRSMLQGAGRQDWRVLTDPRRVPVTGIERMTP